MTNILCPLTVLDSVELVAPSLPDNFVHWFNFFLTEFTKMPHSFNSCENIWPVDILLLEVHGSCVF